MKNYGSRYAVLVGLPAGIVVSSLMLFVSLFPPIDLLIYAAGFQSIWHPLALLSILVVYTYALWKAGKNIVPSLNKNGFKLALVSLRFTAMVNIYLYALILLIFIVGAIFSGEARELFLRLPIAALALLAFFTPMTLFTSITIGLLIVHLTRKKIPI